MALKDLVSKRAALTEGAIEEIISSYVRFDPEERVVIFTPNASGLQNRARILVYLVALQGWPFVSDEEIPIDAKPSEIEEHIGIQGGTLRPILKELKDRHIVSERNGRYFVRPASLEAIKAEFGTSGKDTSASNRIVRVRKRLNHDQKQVVAPNQTEEVKESARRKQIKKTGNLKDRFIKWIADGFFDAPKTLSDVQKRFHKEGLIVPRTSVPKYLLQAVRSGELVREEKEVNQRRVWIYQREK
ncbi:MAG TPA: hypothetical protein VND94_11720 [Terriglobia bacterium]|nr:hypothetical protein [Terriglobia bacterium]